PGLLTTVQDLGRVGLAHLGVPTAGAVDRRAFGLANRLVGNRPDAAALEITLAGPELELEAGGWVALTGGQVAAELGERAVPMDVAVRVEPGQVLRIGSLSSGLRAYLAVRGGIGVAEVLGSRSTDTLAGIGPPRLEEGTRLPVGDLVQSDPFQQVAPTPRIGLEPLLRAVRGPRDDLFTDGALHTLIATAWTVSSDSDRTGIRLEGPVLERRRKVELASEGMVEGSLQVPPDGHPILFLANHPTTGGYPVIAVVAGRDLPLAAQARPGTRLRFRLVSVTAARQSAAAPV
ncbi:MAG TPA: biotin-dependent carboxyltransferase family protein, partial [Actinomycetes bacterium]|nr:biotin-dependent carboxyltransferase family protein [Actinomycetes bacterium]